MTNPHDDWLKTLLDDAEPYIDDAGFSHRVLQALPPPRGERWRLQVLALTGLLAGLVGFVVLPGGQRLMSAVTEVATAVLLRSSVSLVSVTLVTLLLTTGAAYILGET